jgi:hypothetical protein
MASIKKRARWEIAIWLVVCLSIIFLSVKGYANHRYQLSMLPILLAVILGFRWNNLQYINKFVKWSVYVFCWIILLFGFYLSKNQYTSYLNAYIFNEEFTHPRKMVEYLKHNTDLKNDEVILEFGQPFLYYYTDKRGLYYQKIIPIFTKFKKKKEKTFYIIKDKYKVKYILTDTLMEKILHGTSIGNFLEYFASVNCNLVYEDNGKRLYKIEDSFYDTSIEAFTGRVPNLNIDESSWAKIDAQSSNEISSNRNLPIIIQGIRGKFLFEKVNYNNRFVLRVRSISADDGVKPELQFGFRGVEELKIQEGDLVSLLSETRVIGHEKKAAHIFIQDKTEKWTRKREYIKNKKWRQHLVVYKMRNGFKKMGIGFYWEPASNEDVLEIASTKIYLKRKEF